ncbi:MarR family winged helix-turn-helix transcriptional regulator [Curtobacterium albidum]|uniref:MarR family winged helix-turn-helix transcriptional regulator n=1 Tax=Curtobacterium citreum TaxID=2036 RepID=UPI002026A0C6|nr:MarR family winged helix-turn-helix transcriptional regulator [Curtobacterium albidum]MCL9664035.1 MarR family winged helix-turn-helix transcriptional regulator [Curtobacterium albidum]
MQGTDASDATTQVARRLSDRIGPFRRALLRTSREVADLPDLPDAQVEVMRALTGSTTTPSALADRLGLARSTVSNLVSAMESVGLVERRLAAGDGRRTELRLTPLAEERLAAYDEASTAVLVEALGRLAPEDRTALAAALPALEHLHHEITHRDDH